MFCAHPIFVCSPSPLHNVGDPDATLRLLKSETLRCRPGALAALMADHTQVRGA